MPPRTALPGQEQAVERRDDARAVMPARPGGVHRAVNLHQGQRAPARSSARCPCRPGAGAPASRTSPSRAAAARRNRCGQRTTRRPGRDAYWSSSGHAGRRWRRCNSAASVPMVAAASANAGSDEAPRGSLRAATDRRHRPTRCPSRPRARSTVPRTGSSTGSRSRSWPGRVRRHPGVDTSRHDTGIEPTPNPSSRAVLTVMHRGSLRRDPAPPPQPRGTHRG